MTGPTRLGCTFSEAILWALCRFALHVLMVEHGKRCERCAKNGKPRKESHGPCPLVNLAHAAGKSNKLNAKAAARDAEEAISLKAEDIVKEEPDIKEEAEAKAEDDVSDADTKIKPDPEGEEKKHRRSQASRRPQNQVKVKQEEG